MPQTHSNKDAEYVERLKCQFLLYMSIYCSQSGRSSSSAATADAVVDGVAGAAEAGVEANSKLLTSDCKNERKSSSAAAGAGAAAWAGVTGDAAALGAA
jgi:hypothetical protein